jgi:preprotein translocase subunit SecD
MKAVILALAFALACSAAQVKDRPRADFEMRFAEREPADGLVEVTFDKGKYYLHEKSVITNKDIADAQAIEGIREGIFCVQISLTPEGAENLSKATKGNAGKLMAILMNGEIKSAATIMGEISSIFILEGNFTREQAEKLADGIKSK